MRVHLPQKTMKPGGHFCTLAGCTEVLMHCGRHASTVVYPGTEPYQRRAPLWHYMSMYGHPGCIIARKESNIVIGAYPSTGALAWVHIHGSLGFMGATMGHLCHTGHHRVITGSCGTPQGHVYTTGSFDLFPAK